MMHTLFRLHRKFQYYRIMQNPMKGTVADSHSE
jgi:hypothetical protein